MWTAVRLGIPRAEQDADGELLLGACRRCQATRLLSSLEEHEASCRPEPERARQASPAAAPLPAASEGPGQPVTGAWHCSPCICALPCHQGVLPYIAWAQVIILTAGQPLQQHLSDDAVGVCHQFLQRC